MQRSLSGRSKTNARKMRDPPRQVFEGPLQERSERIRLLHERQAREIEQFDDESNRLGFR